MFCRREKCVYRFIASSMTHTREEDKDDEVRGDIYIFWTYTGKKSTRIFIFIDVFWWFQKVIKLLICFWFNENNLKIKLKSIKTEYFNVLLCVHAKEIFKYDIIHFWYHTDTVFGRNCFSYYILHKSFTYMIILEWRRISKLHQALTRRH